MINGNDIKPTERLYCKILMEYIMGYIMLLMELSMEKRMSQSRLQTHTALVNVPLMPQFNWLKVDGFTVRSLMNVSPYIVKSMILSGIWTFGERPNRLIKKITTLGFWSRSLSAYWQDRTCSLVKQEED